MIHCPFGKLLENSRPMEACFRPIFPVSSRETLGHLRPAFDHVTTGGAKEAFVLSWKTLLLCMLIHGQMAGFAIHIDPLFENPWDAIQLRDDQSGGPVAFSRSRSGASSGTPPNLVPRHCPSRPPIRVGHVPPPATVQAVLCPPVIRLCVVAATSQRSMYRQQ